MSLFAISIDIIISMLVHMQVLYRVYIYWGRHCNKQTTTHTHTRAHISFDTIKIGIDSWTPKLEHILSTVFPLYASSNIKLLATFGFELDVVAKHFCHRWHITLSDHLPIDWHVLFRSFVLSYVRSIDYLLVGWLACFFNLSLSTCLPLSLLHPFRKSYVCVYYAAPVRNR